jgi:hypothetical protein
MAWALAIGGAGSAQTKRRAPVNWRAGDYSAGVGGLPNA